jgi:excisionase family DNA binding protein
MSGRDPATPAQLLEVVELLEEIRDRQPKVCYSVPEAARMLGVSDDLIYRLVVDGVIAKVPHMGRRVIIPHAELERLAGSRGGSESAGQPDLRLA